MANDTGFIEAEHNRKRALLLDYLEHTSNKVERKSSEVARPAKVIQNKEVEPAIPAVVLPVLIEQVPAEIKPEPMPEPIEEKKSTLDINEEKLKFFRQKRDLLEQILTQADKEAEEKKKAAEEEGKDELAEELPVQEAAPIAEEKQEVKIVAVGQEAMKQPEIIKPEVAMLKVEEALKQSNVLEFILPIKEKTKAIAISILEKIKKLFWHAMRKFKQTEFYAFIKPNFSLDDSKEEIRKFTVKFSKKLRRKGIRRLGRQVRHFAYGSFVFGCGFYLAYILLIYSFSPRSWFFNKLSDTLPVPAVISSYGLVDYYSYEQIKADAKSSGSLEDPAYLALKTQVIGSLAKKYKLDANLDQDLLLEVLKRRVVSDASLNYYGSRKYIELRQGIRQGNGIAKLAEETDLTLHRASYAKKAAADNFGDLIYGLPLNGVSPVIINKRGIYVISPVKVNDTKIDFYYLFVPARTLEQLMEENLSDAWLINLVN